MRHSNRAGGRSTVSSKGQVTIPKGVRERYGLSRGTEVVFELREDGALLTRPKAERHAAWDAIGSLRAAWRWPKGVPRTVDAYVDHVRGGSYEELGGRTRPPRRKRRNR